jgi:chemotaxis protein CheD
MKPHLVSHPGSHDVEAPSGAEPQETGSSNFHFLHAGQVFVSARAQSISLILGSCVAVCIWDPVSAIGGATHYMLPNWDGRGVPSARYGSVAISILLQKLLESGANRSQLRAKVFGGGCLFGSKHESNKESHLGSRNVEIALDLLAKAQIPVVSTEVGVDRGQRVVFHTATGAASIKSL